MATTKVILTISRPKEVRWRASTREGLDGVSQSVRCLEGLDGVSQSVPCLPVPGSRRLHADSQSPSFPPFLLPISWYLTVTSGGLGVGLCYSLRRWSQAVGALVILANNA